MLNAVGPFAHISLVGVSALDMAHNHRENVALKMRVCALPVFLCFRTDPTSDSCEAGRQLATKDGGLFGVVLPADLESSPEATP